MKRNRNIQIDDELWKTAKVEAAKQGQTMQEFVSNALETAVYQSELENGHSDTNEHGEIKPPESIELLSVETPVSRRVPHTSSNNNPVNWRAGGF